MTKNKFGVTKDGKEVFAYVLENKNGMKAQIISYGAILTHLFVPDKNGKLDDVVLGFDKLEDYYANGSFFGATVGPSANRIAGAKFKIGNNEYNLAVNDGPNNLHSDFDNGYHKCVWEEKAVSDNSVTLVIKDSDGNMGFPGNKVTELTYSLSEDNELKLAYHSTSDKDTVINLTNHTYFNLNGHNSGKIHDHVLKLNCSNYTPVVEGAIPTGEIASVKGTVMDFTNGKAIGLEIEADFEQLHLTKGYDHNFVIDGADGKLREIAEAFDPASGRTMKTFTTLPGVQFYAGNCIAPVTGKGNASYDVRCGFCLETQYYPNTVNQPNFPSAVFGPSRDYDSVTVYQFM